MAGHFIRIPSELPLRVSHISPKSGLLLCCDFAFREPLYECHGQCQYMFVIILLKLKDGLLKLGAGNSESVSDEV